MKYKIREKLFSIGDSFSIKDQHNNDMFLVKEKILTLGKKLRIMSLEGEELIYIEQELLSFLPRYSIYQGGNHLATVKKEFTFFKPSFNIESIKGNYSALGDIFSHEFTLLKDNETVARVSKEWFSFSDTYGVDVKDDENHPFVLALVIVIDQVLHDKKN